MHPHLDISIFGLEFHAQTSNFLYALYSVLAIFAFGLAFRREKQVLPATLLAIAIVLSAFLGARLFHLLVEKPIDQFQLSQLFRFDGMTFYGSLIGGILATAFGSFLVLGKTSVSKALDIASIITAFGYGVLRLGCFANGCCWGKLTAVPWAVRYFESPVMPALGLPVHPVQIYDSMLGFALGLLLIQMRRKRSVPSGDLFLVFLIVYSMGRIVTELFRGDQFRGENVFLMFSTSQTISLALIAAAALALTVRIKKVEARS